MSYTREDLKPGIVFTTPRYKDELDQHCTISEVVNDKISYHFNRGERTEYSYTSVSAMLKYLNAGDWIVVKRSGDLQKTDINHFKPKFLTI